MPSTSRLDVATLVRPEDVDASSGAPPRPATARRPARPPVSGRPRRRAPWRHARRSARGAARPARLPAGSTRHSGRRARRRPRCLRRREQGATMATPTTSATTAAATAPRLSQRRRRARSIGMTGATAGSAGSTGRDTGGSCGVVAMASRTPARSAAGGGSLTASAIVDASRAAHPSPCAGRDDRPSPAPAPAARPRSARRRRARPSARGARRHDSPCSCLCPHDGAQADQAVADAGLHGAQGNPQTISDLHVGETVVERQLERLALDVGELGHGGEGTLTFLALDGAVLWRRLGRGARRAGPQTGGCDGPARCARGRRRADGRW